MFNEDLLLRLKTFENSARRDLTEDDPVALLMPPLTVLIIGDNEVARFDVESFLVYDRTRGNLSAS